MKISNQILFIMLSLCAGMMIPFQSAMNAQLGKTLQSPYFSALTVFIVAAVWVAKYNCSHHQLAMNFRRTDDYRRCLFGKENLVEFINKTNDLEQYSLLNIK